MSIAFAERTIEIGASFPGRPAENPAAQSAFAADGLAPRPPRMSSSPDALSTAASCATVASACAQQQLEVGGRRRRQLSGPSVNRRGPKSVAVPARAGCG